VNPAAKASNTGVPARESSSSSVVFSSQSEKKALTASRVRESAKTRSTCAAYPASVRMSPERAAARSPSSGIVCQK